MEMIVEQAEGGDLKATQWLAGVLLGGDPPSLSDLAAYEETNIDPVKPKVVELLAEAESAELRRMLLGLRLDNGDEDAPGDPDGDETPGPA